MRLAFDVPAATALEHVPPAGIEYLWYQAPSQLEMVRVAVLWVTDEAARAGGEALVVNCDAVAREVLQAVSLKAP